MEQRFSLVTLGVADLRRARQFYEKGLGWTASAAGDENVTFFQAGGVVLALYPRRMLAEDANLSEAAGSGFGGIALAYNARRREEVDDVIRQAEAAGATILKRPADVFWGGYSGYFADPDGHPWEVAWNPHFPLDAAGNIKLPR